MTTPIRLTETVLTTERLTLRAPGPQDAEAIMAFYRSPRAAMAGGHVGARDALKLYMAVLGHWVHAGYGLWAVTLRGDDTILGLVGPYFPPGRPETEIGWLIFDGHEGKGYAHEAARAALDHARSTLGWTEIVHYIHPDNARSITLAERLGARLDPDAEPVRPGVPCAVYRQPRPEAAA